MEIPLGVGLIAVAVCVVGVVACLVWWARHEKPRVRDGRGSMGDGGGPGPGGGMGGGV